jgi:deazaflavin-dependent oxidoreductase (nitroreductase family)
MPKQYHLTPMIRLTNGMFKVVIPLGLAPAEIHLLTVKGRTTGKRYTTPVELVTQDNQRYIVSPYGITNWVKNARAAGSVSLRKGKHEETVNITEVDSVEAAPILKTYITRGKISRPYFDVTPDSPIEDFEKEAPQHPVFRIVN